jgi:hypothetical protein
MLYVLAKISAMAEEISVCDSVIGSGARFERRASADRHWVRAIGLNRDEAVQRLSDAYGREPKQFADLDGDDMELLLAAMTAWH